MLRILVFLPALLTAASALADGGRGPMLDAVKEAYRLARSGKDYEANLIYTTAYELPIGEPEAVGPDVERALEWIHDAYWTWQYDWLWARCVEANGDRKRAVELIEKGCFRFRDKYGIEPEDPAFWRHYERLTGKRREPVKKSSGGGDAFDVGKEQKEKPAPTGVEWENAHDAELKAAVADAELDGATASASAADALLACVKGAYETDPLTATKVAAVTARVMEAGRGTARRIWAEALLRAAETATDDYRRTFVLEQLRWCGLPSQVPGIRKLGGAASAGVRDFADLVARELTPAAPPGRTAGTRAEDLVERWLDALVQRQVRGTGDGALDGGVLCPACAAMHGRTVDAVWPLVWQYGRTGDRRWLEAAERLVAWARRNLLRPDGSIINDPNMEWRGISVFSQTALGKALYRCGDRLPAAVRAEWTDFFRRQSDYVRDWMRDGAKVLANPNYRCCMPLAMELAARVLGDRGYRAVGLVQADVSLSKIAPDGILTGEARPCGEVAPKGVLAADIGYNVEESLPALIEWAEMVGDRDRLAVILACAEKQLEFFLPDGGIDDSFGSRACKWTYWGSRTSDGALPMLAALAKRGNADAARAAGAVLGMYARCTDPKRGILAGGPDYVAADELPCMHHLFAKLKTLPDFIEAKCPPSDGKPLFHGAKDGLRRWNSIGVTTVRAGDWRATFSESDIRLAKDRFESTGGGSLTLLHHAELGPVFAATMVRWAVLERMNMQTQLRSDVERSFTPRIEAGDGRFTSVFDDRVTLSAAEREGVFTVTAKGKLRDAELAAGPAFTLVWTLSRDGVSVRAECAAAANLVLPVVSDAVTPVTAAKIEQLKTDRPGNRVFSSQVGLLARYFTVPLTPDAAVDVRLKK